MCPIFDKEHRALVRRYCHALQGHIKNLQEAAANAMPSKDKVSRERLLMAEQSLWEKERALLERFAQENEILRNKINQLIKIRCKRFHISARVRKIPGKDLC